ncbi:hypothetical protein SB781_34255, partial [Paraburkholderia sp. SIMBA_061]
APGAHHFTNPSLVPVHRSTPVVHRCTENCHAMILGKVNRMLSTADEVGRLRVSGSGRSTRSLS